jgi:hypothetical protein
MLHCVFLVQRMLIISAEGGSEGRYNRYIN